MSLAIWHWLIVLAVVPVGLILFLLILKCLFK